MGHEPFLADYPASAWPTKVADDRGASSDLRGDFAKPPAGDFADDALAGVTFQKKPNGNQSKQIGLIGHSEEA